MAEAHGVLEYRQRSRRRVKPADLITGFSTIVSHPSVATKTSVSALAENDVFGRFSGVSLDLRQLLFLALLSSLALAALGWAVVALVVARRHGARGSTSLSDTRALRLERTAGDMLIGSEFVAAAGRGDGVILGSGERADVRLNLPELEARHARLTRVGGRLFLTNLGQQGSVAVSDVPLPANRPWPLHPGDRVRLGTTDFVARVS